MFITVLHPIVLIHDRIFFYYIDDEHLGFQWTITSNALVGILMCVPVGALVWV